MSGFHIVYVICEHWRVFNNSIFMFDFQYQSVLWAIIMPDWLYLSLRRR